MPQSGSQPHPPTPKKNHIKQDGQKHSDEYVEQGLALFLTKLGVGIVQDEPDGRKEIALPRAVSAHDYIETRAERANNHLVTIRLKPVYR